MKEQYKYEQDVLEVQDDSGLMEYYNLWRKHVKAVAKVTLAFGVLATAYCFVVAPTYQATSIIRIKDSKGFGADIMRDNNRDMQKTNTYLGILRTEDVIENAKKLLEQNPDPEVVKQSADLGRQISTTAIKNMDLAAVSVLSTNYKYAKIANDALLQAFMDKLTEVDQRQYGTTRKFLEGRVANAKKDLQRYENILVAFQKEHKIITPDKTVTAMEMKLEEADKRKAENKVQLAMAQAKAAAVAGKMQGENMPLIADSNTLMALDTRLAELEAQRAEYSTKLKPKHPVMQKLNKDIAELQKQLQAEQKRVAQGSTRPTGAYAGMLQEKLHSEIDAEAAASNMQTLNELEEEYAHDIESMSELNRDHLRLLRDVSVAQELYIMLSKRLEEAKIAEVATSQDVQIISGARENKTPVAPVKRKVIGFAMLLGFALSSALALAKELLNRTVKTAEDMENYLGVPVLGQVPDYDSLQRSMTTKKTQSDLLDKLKGVLKK